MKQKSRAPKMAKLWQLVQRKTSYYSPAKLFEFEFAITIRHKAYCFFIPTHVTKPLFELFTKNSSKNKF